MNIVGMLSYIIVGNKYINIKDAVERKAHS